MSSTPNGQTDQGSQQRNLTEWEAKRLLASRGIAVPSFQLVASPEEAARAASSLGFPVVVKVASRDILHKSDVGGVALGVTTPEQAAEAFEQVIRSARAARPDAKVETALVETMCPAGGVEVIVGLVRDHLFGPVVMVGLGGIFVEVLKDVAFRSVPIGRCDAHEMLAELKGAPMLDGVRGRPPVDREALVDLLTAVAGPDGLAAVSGGEPIAELDFNPVFAYPRGLMVADARIVLAGEGEAAAEPTDLDDLRDAMRAVFQPGSIALFGASADPTKMGYRTMRRLADFGYRGKLYPIHPRATEIYGCRAYPRVTDIAEPVDRAIVMVRAESVPDVVTQCVEKGVRVAHIYTAGFSELSQAGRQAERDMLARVSGTRLRLLGPNSVGTYVPSQGITLIDGSQAEAGHVSVVSQSGGLTIDMVRRGAHQGIRFSKAISIGNAIDLDPSDFLRYFAIDPDTRLIGGYVESVRDGRKLREALGAAAREGKPIVLLKGGRTRGGQRAAASHTGALASDFAIWSGLFRQFGVSAVQNLEELLDTLLAFQMLPLPQSPTVALVGPGGGISVTSTDAADLHGVAIPPFGPDTVAALQALKLPPGTSLVNPLDVPAPVLQAEQGAVLGRVLKSAVDDSNVAALVVHLNMVPILGLAPIEQTAGLVHNMVGAVIGLKSQTDKPLCLVLRSSGEQELDDVARPEGQRALEAGIPVFAGIEQAIAALAHLYRYRRFVEERRQHM